MFGVLAELENAIEKVAASEAPLDVAAIWELAERVEFLKVRAVGEFDRSGDWQADAFVSGTAAVRAKCRTTHGAARRAIVLARKLESLPETAAAFEAGAIGRDHAEVIARACTPARAEMMAGIEAEVVAFARIADPDLLRDAVGRFVDAFDGDGGAGRDSRQRALNEVRFAEVGGRGILNGSLDAELSKLADAAFDAEMEKLRRPNESRLIGERRAEAFESMCRRSLHELDDGTTRRRGRPHMLFVQDIRDLEGKFPELVADVRAEASRFGLLTRSTLDRIACDCSFARVLMDGPSQVIDVGRLTRTVSTAEWNALVARDQHCQAPGCTRPPAQCEAHHIWYWSLGGPTSLWNLKLLCWHHHREAHKHDAQPRAG